MSKAELAAYRRAYGCLACGEDHSEASSCPPHECRTSGIAWFDTRMRAAVARCTEREADLARVTAERDELRLAIANSTADRTEAIRRAEKAETERDKARAEIDETFTDERGTVWNRPTAWAYHKVCVANGSNQSRASAAEARIAELERLLGEERRATSDAIARSVIVPESAERQAIVDSVEEWANRMRGGDATVDEVAYAVIEAMTRSGWKRPAAIVAKAEGVGA